jgi:16S rRNA (guanine527-N7)-methyltransferase
MIDLLNNCLIEFDLNIENIYKDKLIKYWNFILEYNKKINLISRVGNDPERFISHIFDSITPLILKLPEKASHLDLGSGGGFPGLALNIVQKNWSTTLVDSKLKKCKFLESAINLLELPNCKVLNMFLKSGNNSFNKLFDVITVRALASISDLTPLLGCFLDKNGIGILFKGPNGLNELEEANELLKINDIKFMLYKEFDLPFINKKRQLIILTKN